MTSRIEAWAGLAENVGAALQTFGSQLRASAEPVRSPAAPRAPIGEDAEDGLGSSQLRVLEAVREAGAVGVTSHAVAKMSGVAGSNTPRILKSLLDRGLVSAGGDKPTIWTATP